MEDLKMFSVKDFATLIGKSTTYVYQYVLAKKLVRYQEMGPSDKKYYVIILNPDEIEEWRTKDLKRTPGKKKKDDKAE